MIGKTKSGFIVAVGAALVGLIGSTSGEAHADLIQLQTPLRLLGTTVAIECSNPGSHQDVAKTPILKNTSGAPMKAGQVIAWRSSDGDAGSVKLDKDLAVGASVQGLGHAGQGYTCTSTFFTRPDLAIRTAQFKSASEVTVDVQNLDAWAAAGPSVVKVEIMSCSGPVLATINTAATPLAKGETKSITVPFAVASGERKYIRVRADANAQVSETNETNNLWDSMGSCVH